MKRIKVKKLFNGKVSIRDYVVEEAIKANEYIEVIFSNKSMLLSPIVLKQGTSNGIVFNSRWEEKSYTLIDFDFKPIDQMSLV